jgi:S1-C subfamily serine protease
MIKQILFSIFLSLSLFANDGVKSFVIENNNIQILILYPSKIVQGTTIKLIGVMKNLGKDAYMGGLTLSFPQFRHTLGQYHKNTFDTISKYSPPDKIYNTRLKKAIKSRYYMIEGWENGWKRGKEKDFFIELKIPSDIKEIVVNVRGILIYKNKNHKKEIKIPKQSNIKDQQSYFVKKLIIPIYRGSPTYAVAKPREKRRRSRAKISSGTGFFINKNTVVTNQHVIQGCRNIKIFRDNFETSAKIRYSDKINDLAVLSSNKRNRSFLKFRNKRLRIGETIVTMGYPLGDLLGTNIKLTTGNISSLTGLLNDSSKLQLTAPVQHGNSGGPLLDNSGNIIGVIYAGLNSKIAQNVNLAIKAYTLRMFLDTNSIDYTVSSNNKKKEIVDIADEAKKSIVEVICKH